MYNGELVESKVYTLSKLEESIIPYSEDEKCCVCFENTSDITLCNHSICLTCRETSIINSHLDCPICRNSNILRYYNNRNNLVNNEQFSIIKKAIHSEKIALPSNRSYHNETSSNRTEELEIVEWYISRTPTVFRHSELEDGEIDERLQNTSTIDLTHDDDSFMNRPITLEDLQTPELQTQEYLQTV